MSDSDRGPGNLPDLSGATGEACPVPGTGTRVGRLRMVVLRPILGGIDAAYVMFQGVLKSMGIVASEGGPPPEEATEEGRFAVLPERPGRWPELRIRLPASAVYAFSVEGMFRRAGMWRALTDLDTIRPEIEAAIREAWGPVRERHGRGILEFTHEAHGVTHTIKLTVADDGTTYLGIGQKLGRLRDENAHRPLKDGSRQIGPG